ncbi:MAG: RIP metalloprotease RseP [Firmicutes bacterium]|nr:RIP metalloprotease RseP [Bacillota bacterium]
MTTLVAFMIMLGLLIFVHEFGHFIVAKRVGIKVEEFALGMGPKLVSAQVGETAYSLRVLPLGGFCKMAGENQYEDKKGDAGATTPARKADEGRMFYDKPVWQRAAVLGAGPFMNFVLAAVIFMLFFAVVGVPTDFSQGTVIGDVLAGGPAADAGLLPGDQVLAVNDIQVQNWDELAKAINAYPNVEVKMTILRQGRQMVIKTVPKPDRPGGVGLIGIWPKATRTERVGAFKAVGLGFVQTGRVIAGLYVALVQIITGEIIGPLTGPVGIAKIAGQAARFGLANYLYLTALLSVQLGILNLLPLPALDGGRLVFLGVEAVRRRPVNPEREGFVHFIGFALLMLFLLVITFKDIMRLNIF